MLTADQIKDLKRSNASIDPAKTKQRAEELLRPAKMKEKQAIRELAGVTTQVLSNIYRTGNLSIKMVIAISQMLNVDPFYLTGEADEPGEFTDEALRALLLKRGYRAFVASLELPEKKKRPYTRRTQAEDAAPPRAEEEVPEEPEVEVEEPTLPEPEAQTPIECVALDEADLRLLLDAATLKAKAGPAAAKERFEQIKQLLLA